MQAQSNVEYKTEEAVSAVNSQAAEVIGNEGQHVLIANPASLFNHDDRAQFYTGQDRMTLQARQIQKVRELQETNDNLQRQIARNEKALVHAEDPLSILAEIEHCNIMIARNAGEILNIHSQNERRL